MVGEKKKKGADMATLLVKWDTSQKRESLQATLVGNSKTLDG